MKRLFIFLILGLVATTAVAQTAAIYGDTTYQTMDGFGAQDWSYNVIMTSPQVASFFSPTPGTGIGLSLIRTENVWDAGNSSGGVPPDLAVLQAAVGYGAQVELSFGSLPCGATLPATYFPSPNNAPNLKYASNESGEACSFSSNWFTGGPAWADGSISSNGTCFTANQALTTSYSQYATYIVNYVKMLEANGVPVTFLDIQNEPNTPSGTTGACLWSNGNQFDTFVGTYLGPAMTAAGLTSTKLVLGNAYDWFASDFTSACLSDQNCAKYVSIASGHGYSFPYTPSSYTPGTSNGKHVWMNETSIQGNGPYDATMTTALAMAENMQAFLNVAQVSSYDWWNLSYLQSASNYGLTACPAVVGNGGCNSYVYGKQYYAYGNFSLFIRPGWVEIQATYQPQSGVYITAFTNPSTGAFAIVAVNANGNSVSQPFSLSNLPATSVTPYITDPNNNLAQQSNIAVSGGSFSATLTSQSVTTLVSNSSGIGLTVQTAGSGSGTLSGTNCASGSYASGTQISCTATAGSGSTFAGWSGGVCSGTGSCTFTLSSASTVIATFNSSGGSGYSLTVSTNGSGSGTISGYNCATGTYAPNTPIGACTATPAAGSVFAGWTAMGALWCTGGTGTCGPYSLTANSTLTATFNHQ